MDVSIWNLISEKREEREENEEEEEEENENWLSTTMAGKGVTSQYEMKVVCVECAG